MRLGLVSLLVPEYAPALTFFVDGLSWDLVSDEDQGRKRWIVVRPPGAETGLVLARASTDAQRAAIGAQTGGAGLVSGPALPGGRVFLFLETEDFAATAARIEAAGGRFQEAPRDEPYGRVAVWRDLWGNHWDLIEPG